MRPTPPTSDTSGTRAVWLLSAALAAIGLAVSIGTIDWSLSWADIAMLVPTAVAFAGIEYWVIKIRLSRRTQSLTLSEIPLVIGLFVLNPPVLLIGRTLGVIPTFVAARRQPGFKVAFNVAHQWWETLLAILIFTALTPDPAHELGRAGIAALAVGVMATILGAVAITLAIWTSSGRRPRGMVLEVCRQSIGPLLASTAFGVVIVATIHQTPALLWAPALTLGVLLLAYRSHVRLIHLHDRQSRTLDLAKTLDGSSGLAPLVDQAVESVAGLSGVSAVGVIRHPDDTAPLVLAARGDTRRLIAAAMATASHAGDRARSGEAMIDGRQIRQWRMADSDHLLVVELDPGTPGLEDLPVLLDQVATHVGLAFANAMHIDALRRQAEIAEHEALNDPLTDMPNRTATLRGLEDALAAGKAFSVLLMDLDDFKEVNDALGHAAGDEVLIEVSRRLAPLTPRARLVSRLGGDEFAMIVPGGQQAARDFAGQVLSAISAPVDVPPYSLQISGSVGIAVHPGHGKDADTLLKHADVAMYDAKSNRSNISVFGADAAGKAVRQLEISAAFRTAVENGAITAVYQPQIDLLTGRVVGVEALARWAHETLGPVSPDEFIKVAEQSGQLPVLTERMIDDALAWQGRWASQGLDLRVSVNLSARSLLDAELPRRIADALDRHDSEPGSLGIEITENSVISDPHRALAVLQRLAHLGVHLSIDDFGTGYSSLAYLQQLPVDEVKIDKSFVLPIGDEQGAVSLVGGIIRLCHEMGFSVVAEGIETGAAQSLLRRLGCDGGQGYHIAHPMPGADLPGWLVQRQANLEHLAPTVQATAPSPMMTMPE